MEIGKCGHRQRFQYWPEYQKDVTVHFLGTVTSEPVKMEKSIIQIVPNYPNSSHPQHDLKLTQPLKEPANRTYESGYDSLQRPSSSHRPTTLRGKDDSKMTNSLPNDAVLSGSHSSLVGSQASSLFDQIAGKNVEIGALKNQVYMLRKNLESQVNNLQK